MTMRYVESKQMKSVDGFEFDNNNWPNKDPQYKFLIAGLLLNFWKEYL